MALLQRRGQRRGASALGEIVGVGEQDPHRPAHLRLGHRQDARRAAADNVERFRVGDPHGESAGHRVGRIGADRRARGE